MRSTKYRNWLAKLGLNPCSTCKSRHGKIYLAEEAIVPVPPLHPHCRCVIEWLKAHYAGTATNKGENGADWWLKWIGKLPDYYITKAEARNKGYIPETGNLADVAPGKMLAKGVYKNKNGHLPQAVGRTWNEADINYTGGYRGMERIVYSNDGLVFVTYDHYRTFQVII